MFFLGLAVQVPATNWKHSFLPLKDFPPSLSQKAKRICLPSASPILHMDTMGKGHKTGVGEGVILKNIIHYGY